VYYDKKTLRSMSLTLHIASTSAIWKDDWSAVHSLLLFYVLLSRNQSCGQFSNIDNITSHYSMCKFFRLNVYLHISLFEYTWCHVRFDLCEYHSLNAFVFLKFLMIMIISKYIYVFWCSQSNDVIFCQQLTLPSATGGVWSTSVWIWCFSYVDILSYFNVGKSLTLFKPSYGFAFVEIVVLSLI
jgi:hypothetical protein